MDIPLQIAFKAMENSSDMQADIRRKVDWLGQFSKNIVSCRVAVEMPHRSSRNGGTYSLKIHITMPAGGEIAVDRDPPIDAHQHFPVALRDAFNSARRQLKAWERAHTPKHAKHHEPPPRGRVVELVPAEGYGFITAPDGREIYFHRNSVADAAFDSLEVGSMVLFSEEEGDKGPQATHVQVFTQREL
jgi:cold shock CspA family protein